jgi:hypothetical protein
VDYDNFLKFKTEPKKIKRHKLKLYKLKKKSIPNEKKKKKSLNKLFKSKNKMQLRQTFKKSKMINPILFEQTNKGRKWSKSNQRIAFTKHHKSVNNPKFISNLLNQKNSHPRYSMNAIKRKGRFKSPNLFQKSTSTDVKSPDLMNKNLLFRKKKKNLNKINIQIIKSTKTDLSKKKSKGTIPKENISPKLNNSTASKIFKKRRIPKKKFRSCDFVSNLEICKTIKQLDRDNRQFIKNYRSKKIQLPLLIFHKRYLALHEMLGNI